MKKPDFCQYMILGTSAELVSDRKSCNITSKATDTPHYVLGRLKGNGYRVVRVSSVGETCVWTCEYALSRWMRRNSNKRWSCVIWRTRPRFAGIFSLMLQLCVVKKQTIHSCFLLYYRYPLNLIVLNVLRSWAVGEICINLNILVYVFFIIYASLKNTPCYSLAV